jgi:ribosomal protein S18 acetylase RimI-like enzyme
VTFRCSTGTEAAQLSRMQELASRTWSWTSRWHPGELAWFWWGRGGPTPTWRVATWHDEGVTSAWAWSTTPGRLDLQVDPAQPELLERVLDWFHDVTREGARVVTVCDAETWLVEALQDRGYAVDRDDPYFAHLRLDLPTSTAATPLPTGTTVRHLRAGEDPTARAAVHRAVFGADGADQPDADAYAQVMRAEGYRASLDWVAEDDHGDPAAFCLSWLDEVTGVAVLEPVGTLSRWRGSGLGRAVVLASLQAAADLGARTARVCARADGDLSALRFYEGLGFRPYARNLSLRA